MDERELANHVVAIVDQAAYRNAVSRVHRVHIAVGGRRVFDFARLNRVFNDISRGTVADGAVLVVDRLPVRRHCRGCGQDFEGAAQDTGCPLCGHPHTEAMTGEEVRLLDIQVDELAS